MKYIIAIGIFQAVLAAVLLWRSRLRNHADDLLILLVVCIGLHLSIKFFIFSFVRDTEVLSMMNTFIGFCYMPLLYLYTLKTIRLEFVPASRWPVFIPFILGTIGYFSVASVLSTAPEAGHAILYWYNMISLWSLLPLDIIFTCLTIYLAIKKLPIQSDERKLIIQVASLFLVIGILGIVFSLIQPFGHSFNYITRSIIYALLIVISIRIMTYRYGSIINPSQQNPGPGGFVADMMFDKLSLASAEVGMASGNETIPALSNDTPAGRGNAISHHSLPIEKRKNLLSQREMFSILLKLESAMAMKRYFTDSELTLDKLSSLTKLNKYHISETLNHFVHKPFYTFVNEYRVQYVKDCLAELSRKDREVNMLALAYEAGFNSKSSFNRYFKEITQQTPTGYLKMVSQKAMV